MTFSGFKHISINADAHDKFLTNPEHSRPFSGLVLNRFTRRRMRQNVFQAERLMADSRRGGPADVMSPFSSARADLGGRAQATDTVIIVAAIVVGLSFGRDVLVPIAIAVLLSFVLAPVTDALTRLRIGTVASVLLAVTLAFALLIGLGAVIGKQVAQLGENLPQYQTVIAKKLQAVRSSGFSKGVVEKAADALHGLDSNLGKSTDSSPAASPSAVPPPDRTFMQVEVHEPAPGPVEILRSIVTALLPPLATTGIVIIFVVFILLQRRDLRDRFIGLIGSHDLHRTTKALDDAAFRLSRYFLALTGINASFGIVIAIGLSLIGVPNPILWGIVGAVLRFVPYIGAFIAAALPLALAAAVDSGWTMVVETALLFVVVEGIVGQVVEPRLFGHTTGMSPLAIIVAAAFWTLIWGAPGLLLSTPITACLVVLGRHVESLNFIELMLGDKPPLSPVESFYQRILASDPDEVSFQAEALLKTMPLLEYYEEVALPALALAQIDVTRGVLERSRQVEVCESVERVVADLSDHVDVDSMDARPAPQVPPATTLPAVADEQSPESDSAVLCVAGRTPLDQAGCAILVQLLERRTVSTRIANPEALTSRGIFGLKTDGVHAICVFYLDHQSLAAVRYSVRRLRKKFVNVPITVCLWGSSDLSAMAETAGADATVSSLRDAIDSCVGTASRDLAGQTPRTTPIELAG
jgi:predicted PurR-regulated permease PerM